MRTIAIDWETFYAKDYTLKKMTTEAYVRDRRFETIFLGVCEEGKKYYLSKYEICPWLSRIDWQDTVLLMHHAHFDGLILTHHYGVKPAFYLDTLSMSRAVHGANVSHSLESLAARYDLPKKTVPYNKFIGLHEQEIALDPALHRELGEGASHDAWLCEQIYWKMQCDYPIDYPELFIIDQTVRMFTEPRFIGDTSSFHAMADIEFKRKERLLEELHVTKEDLTSSAKFVALLEDQGVEVEYKAGKKKPNPCVAKTDPFMRDLLEHADPYVQALAAGRLDVQSSITETRAHRLATMSERGLLSVYLNFYGAHTGRWSGGDKINFQNVPKEGTMRRGIQAPPGHALIIVDFKQVEARLLNVVAGQDDVVDAFRNNRDRYCELASDIFGRTITKADEVERKVGKHCELGSGFGQGWRTFKRTVYRLADLKIEDDVAQRSIDIYRKTHPYVVQLWKEADNLLQVIKTGPGPFDPDRWGPLEIRKGMLILPNGMPMHYELEYMNSGDGPNWFMKTRRGWTKIWGGHLVENYVQGIARVALSNALLACYEHSSGRLRASLLSHDEAVFVVPIEDIEELWLIVHECFTRPLTWLPDAPMDADMFLSNVYYKE